MIVNLEGTILYVTKNITEQVGPFSVSLHYIKGYLMVIMKDMYTYVRSCKGVCYRIAAVGPA